MELAALLPVLLVVVGLLVQPACLFYARAVMGAAAAEGARVLATKAAGVTDEQVTAFVRRRLAAVPNSPLWHEGDWEVEVDGSEGSAEATVRVKGRARPWPLLGWVAAAFADAADGLVTLDVEVKGAVRPSWLGGSYGDWKGAW